MKNGTIICNVSGGNFLSTGKLLFLIAHGSSVLVERVEGFATKEEWTRAYDEINDFEKLLTDDHYIIGKFFYHISKDEQLKRFKDRENNPLKRWKITDEDWRNREKWDEYVEAMEEMFEKQIDQMRNGKLSRSNDKLFARLKTLKVIISLIEDYLLEHNIELPSYYYEIKEGKTEGFET